MGIQFEQLTLAPHQSLSFLVEDITRARRGGLFAEGNLNDLQTWLNVLQHWNAPLVSDTGRLGIEQWLNAVESGSESLV